MKSNNISFGIYKILLVTLVTSLTITGISYIDDKIWNLIMCVIGMLAYSIVGVLFSIGILHGKNAGKEIEITVLDEKEPEIKLEKVKVTTKSIEI